MEPDLTVRNNGKDHLTHQASKPTPQGLLLPNQSGVCAVARTLEPDPTVRTNGKDHLTHQASQPTPQGLLLPNHLT